MRRRTRRILSLLLAAVLAAGLSVPALAADTARTGASPEIQVQVGETLVSFTDVGPTVVNGRVYVPDDSVLSVLGVRYTYDPETKTATAERGDLTVRFTEGQPFMTVIQNGRSATTQMDAAPFLQDGHLMIPVRYEAAAFGCNVGWDDFWKSVLILDVNGILDGMSFTVMDSYLAYSRKLQQAPYSFSGYFTLSMKITEDGTTIPIVSNGKITGLADSSAANMDLAITTDFQGLMDALSEFGESDESMQQLEQLQDIRISYIVNLAENKIYLQSPLFSEAMGIDAEAWISMDLNSTAGLYVPNAILTAPSVADYSASSMREILKAYLASIPLYAEEDIPQIMDAIAGINSLIGDTAFVKNGGTYTSRHTIKQDGITFDFKFVLNLKGTAVSGCSMSIDMKDDEDTISAQLTYTMDERYRTILDLNIDSSDYLQMAFHIVMRYSATDQTPETAPEDGSTVIPITFGYYE